MLQTPEDLPYRFTDWAYGLDGCGAHGPENSLDGHGSFLWGNFNPLVLPECLFALTGPEDLPLLRKPLSCRSWTSLAGLAWVMKPLIRATSAESAQHLGPGGSAFWASSTGTSAPGSPVDIASVSSVLSLHRRPLRVGGCSAPAFLTVQSSLNFGLCARFVSQSVCSR